MLNIIKNTINRVFASGVDSDASAFITATGLSGTTQKSAITTLVKDLKASGLWSKMKAVYPMVTDNYNLLSYTEDFSNGVYTKLNTTITTNTTTAPNGTITADKLIENTTNDQHIFFSSNTANTGQVYTFSAYLKAAEMQYGVIQIVDSSASNKRFTVLADLVNGTIVTTRSLNSPINTSSSITSVGNGWYRVTCTMAQVGGTTCYTNVGISNSSNPSWNAVDFPSYAGTNGNGIYVWGAQLEQSSTLSTYQPILTTPAAFMASQMKYNLKDARDLDAAFRLTWSGGWTYSATGATPNGTNAYADSKLNLLTNLPGYDSSFSVYYRQDLYGTYKIGALGSSFDQGMSAHLGWTNTSGTLYNDHLGRNTIVNNVYGTFNAYHISTVTSTASQKLFRNGVLKVSGAATSGITMPSLNFYFGAANQNGTANYFDPKQIAFGTLSNGLTDTEAILLNQIVEKYQVALSRGVQAAQSFYYNSAYSNEANTYLYSTQITGTTQVSAINTLINGLKANNLWAKMKAVYPFVTDKWNMLGFTEDFSNAAWSKGGGTTVTANSTTAPDGTLTADTIVLPNTGTIAQSLASSSNNTHTLSIYLKASANTTIKLGFLSPGSVVVCNVTTEWQRFTYTYSFTGTTYPQLYNDTGSTVTLFAWGAQAELGSSATTYQPVLGANSYSANVAAQMKFNLVNPQDSDAAFRLAFSGGWTYSTNGAQPNGTNGYADTKLIPSANLSTNNTHISSYIRNTSQGVLLGTDNAFRLWIAPNFNGTNRYAEINNGATTTPTTPISTLIGLWIGSRINASNVKLYNNANTNYSYNILSSGLDTSAIYISARNAGGASNYSSSQVAFSSIGEGLSDADVAILNQLVTDYETSLNRNV